MQGQGFHPAHAPFSVAPISPIQDKLYVVTCISNPVRFHSRYRLYRTFEKQVSDAGAELYTIECAFGGRPFEITNCENPKHIQVRTNDELWHKENLLNIAISRLPSCAKYIAWVDADITFCRSDWAHETVQQLQHFDFVQMFSQAVDLGPNSEILHTSLGWIESMRRGLRFKNVNLNSDLGSCFPFHHGKGLIKGAWHSGFAWAATRQALDAVGGLIDFAILGSADRHMAAGLFGFIEDTVLKNFSKPYREALLEWQKRAEKYIRRNVGQVEGTIFHHFHGKKTDRRYVDRWQILLKNQFNPYTDIKKDTQNLWRFHDDGTHRFINLKHQIREYFRQRNEDSIDT